MTLRCKVWHKFKALKANHIMELWNITQRKQGYSPNLKRCKSLVEIIFLIRFRIRILDWNVQLVLRLAENLIWMRNSTLEAWSSWGLTKENATVHTSFQCLYAIMHDIACAKMYQNMSVSYAQCALQTPFPPKCKRAHATLCPAESFGSLGVPPN